MKPADKIQFYSILFYFILLHFTSVAHPLFIGLTELMKQMGKISPLLLIGNTLNEIKLDKMR